MEKKIFGIMAFMLAVLLPVRPAMAGVNWDEANTAYAYNWDNTDSATQWGLWGGNGSLEGYVAGSLEDINARHEIKLACDGENIGVRITYASCYDGPGNGSDYNFYIGEDHVKFVVTYEDGDDISATWKDPGIYGLDIKHGDGAVSGEHAEGSYGTMFVNEDQLNNVMEISIPLSEVKRQNEGINLKDMSSVEFFTPNLMYEKLEITASYNAPEETPEPKEEETDPAPETPGETPPADSIGEEPGEPETTTEPEAEPEPEPEESAPAEEYWLVACDLMGDSDWVADAISNPNGNRSAEGHQKKYCGQEENQVIRIGGDGLPTELYQMKSGSTGGKVGSPCYLFEDGSYSTERDISTVRPGDRIYWETRNGGETWHHEGIVKDPSRETIERYTEDGSVPEGTLLDVYIDNVDGREVWVREISTLPADDGNGGEENFDPTDHFGLSGEGEDPPSIDNGHWSDVPAQWEYNWDNTEQATQWGIWGGNGHLEGYVTDHMDDINVRHHISMYCDGHNIYLYIEYASCFDGAGNGNDYNFYIDGAGAKIRVVYDDGEDLSGPGREPGEHLLRILHGDGDVSGEDVYGGYGKLMVKEGQLNNVQEIVIPLAELKKQNDAINLESFSKVDFFTPNLMYRTISCAGASTGAVPLAAILVTAAIAYIFANPEIRKGFAEIFLKKEANE